MDVTESGTSFIAVAQSTENTRIIRPGNSGSRYFNYKDFYSIVMLALVDHNYTFLAVDVCSYGKDGDAGIFARSSLGNNLSKGIKFPPPGPLSGTQFYIT
jgi:hypothetical protein